MVLSAKTNTEVKTVLIAQVSHNSFPIIDKRCASRYYFRVPSIRNQLNCAIYQLTAQERIVRSRSLQIKEIRNTKNKKRETPIIKRNRY